jgi:hypothetical protein
MQSASRCSLCCSTLKELCPAVVAAAAAGAAAGVHCLLAPRLMVGNYAQCLALLILVAAHSTDFALLSWLLPPM